MERSELIIVGDFGKDLDDENALLYAVGAERNQESKLLAVVANLDPAEERARLAKGTLNTLGVTIPVGVGTACNLSDTSGSYELDVPYLSDPVTENGQEVMKEALDLAGPNSLIFILNSGLTDAVELIEAEPTLFREKVRKVAIMGGIVVKDQIPQFNSRGYLEPDDAANNRFDMAASEYLYEWLQEERVSMSILTREAAYGCKFSLSFYDQLAEVDGLIGENIRNRQRPAFEHLWQASNAPVGSDERGSLPNRCDRDWFIKTYLSGNDPGDSEIWQAGLEVGTFQLYDPLNVASVLRPELFDPVAVQINGVDHQIIGLSESANGIGNERLLREHIENTILDGLRSNKTL